MAMRIESARRQRASGLGFSSMVLQRSTGASIRPGSAAAPPGKMPVKAVYSSPKGARLCATSGLTVCHRRNVAGRALAFSAAAPHVHIFCM